MTCMKAGKNIKGLSNSVKLFYGKFYVFRLRDHSSITSAKRWMVKFRKWQFFLIYSTIFYVDVVGWVVLESQKHADVILEWSLKVHMYFQTLKLKCVKTEMAYLLSLCERKQDFLKWVQ